MEHKKRFGGGGLHKNSWKKKKNGETCSSKIRKQQPIYLRLETPAQTDLYSL